VVEHARTLEHSAAEGFERYSRQEGMEAMKTADPPRTRRVLAGAIVELLAAALPLIGLVSLLLRSQLDPHFENYRLHFVLFGLVGALAFVLGYAAGEAANRRGDARVLLLSLAFMVTGGFMGLHALGTPGVLFTADHSGFKVAIPVGLLGSACFAAASAFVDLRPGFGALVIRHRRALRSSVLLALGAWFAWTVANLPPLDGPNSEAARGSLLAALAIVGTIVYAVSAARYWAIFRARPTLLPASVIACFVLLSEALIGVALTGERKWHASWWEWHGLIVTAYLIIGFAAHREWREERFRDLYLSTTRERQQEVSVLFSDLVGYTGFAERSTPAEAAAVLQAYWGTAAPLLTQGFGGEVEKFIGDGVVAVFNRTGDQPDHARRASCAALALQREFARMAEEHPDWPRMRVGVNSGEAVVREIGGQGHVAYPLVGDTVNTGARLEGLAPVGGVLIGTQTYERLPDGAVVEPRAGLRVKGKDEAVDAYVLHALAC
jgi:adenylate cyclase